MEQLRNTLSNTSFFYLTSRELETLRLIALGYSNNKISELMVISKKSVENYVNAVYAKFAPHIRNKDDVNLRVFASNYYHKYHARFPELEEKFREINNKFEDFQNKLSEIMMDMLKDEIPEESK
jgi:DNA-binding CsgD family transcriptional regulator